jgi:hypothetical protein
MSLTESGVLPTARGYFSLILVQLHLLPAFDYLETSCSILEVAFSAGWSSKGPCSGPAKGALGTL